MNEIMNAMLSRRSVRKFKSDMIPRETLEQIMEAGLYAANGRNAQETKIVAVTDQAIRNKIMRMNCEIGGWEENFDPFYGAPVILIVLGNKNWPTHVYDGSLVMGNLMLAAHSLDIGSIWIHRAKEEFETEYGKRLLKELGIEGEWEGIGHCALGYAEGRVPVAAPRKTERIYWLEAGK